MTKPFCAVDKSERNHAHNEGLKAAYEDKVSAIACDLLSDDFDPLEVNNFCEALGETSLDDVCALLKAGKHEEAGKMLVEISNGYWTKCAEMQAACILEERQ